MRILLTLLLLSGVAHAKHDCNKHKIYCKIVEINPKINKEFAFSLSNTIYTRAKSFGLDPMLSVAIAAQESGIRNINRYTKGIIVGCAEDCEVVKMISDIGIFQIHVSTANHYNLDLYRLQNDVEYQVQAHMEILVDKIKLCRQEAKAWGCYHSRTKSLKNKYIQLVEKYY